MRERDRRRESAACSSNGWAGKGVYAVPPGLGIALRAEPARREFARGASLSSFFPFLSASSSSSPSSPAPSSLSYLSSQPRFSSRHSAAIFLRSLGSILRQPFRYFFAIATLRLVESEDSQRPIEITRPVVFGLRAYRMVQRPPKAIKHS